MIFTTHPGIGDISWVYSKLVNCGEPLDLIIAEDAKTSRALPFVNLLPKVRSAQYGTMQDYVPLSECENSEYSIYKEAEKSGKRLFISANNYLEDGKRLEGYLPDLPTDFHYEITTSDDDKKISDRYLPEGSVYFGVYSSSQGGVDSWNGWGVHEWTDFICRIRNQYPHVVFVILGAKWDMDLSDSLSRSLNLHGIEHINLAGKTTLGVAVEVLKKLAYFAGFASGMGVLSNVLYMPQIMFYPGYLQKLMYSWPCPASLANGIHQATSWERPINTYKRINTYLNKYLNP